MLEVVVMWRKIIKDAKRQSFHYLGDGYYYCMERDVLCRYEEGRIRIYFEESGSGRKPPRRSLSQLVA